MKLINKYGRKTAKLYLSNGFYSHFNSMALKYYIEYQPPKMIGKILVMCRSESIINFWKNKVSLRRKTSIFPDNCWRLVNKIRTNCTPCKNTSLEILRYFAASCLFVLQPYSYLVKIWKMVCTGVEKLIIKLETLVHQVKTETVLFFNKTPKSKIKNCVSLHPIFTWK